MLNILSFNPLGVNICDVASRVGNTHSITIMICTGISPRCINHNHSVFIWQAGATRNFRFGAKMDGFHWVTHCQVLLFSYLEGKVDMFCLRSKLGIARKYICDVH